MNNVKDIKEKERRKKISNTLRKYYLTEQGITHKNKLSKIQREKMNKLYKTNNQLNNKNNGEKI